MIRHAPGSTSSGIADAEQNGNFVPTSRERSVDAGWSRPAPPGGSGTSLEDPMPGWPARQMGRDAEGDPAWRVTEVNTGVQNTANAPKRDYSLIACFTLVVLLMILVLDAFEYIHVPGKEGIKAGVNAVKSMGGTTDKSELEEIEKLIAEAKETLKEKQEEVEKLVDKVEEEIKEEEKEEAVAEGEPAKAETPESKKEEEEKKQALVSAVVSQQLGIDKYCGGCQYGSMPFTCDKRVSWMMDSYGITREMAIESVIHKCHYRLRRGRVLN